MAPEGLELNHLPPARWYSPRRLTLAYVSDRRIALVHDVRRRKQGFAIVRCVPNWTDVHWSWFPGLAVALLMARERDDVPLAAWEGYEPPHAVKLFLPTDPRWLRRRHRMMRNEFLSLRWPVRQSKRLMAGLERLRRGRPAT